MKVKAFTGISIGTQPQAPITGTTLAERLGLVKVLVDRPSAVMARVTRVILDGPTPVPQDLYEARRWVCALWVSCMTIESGYVCYRAYFLDYGRVKRPRQIIGSAFNRVSTWLRWWKHATR